MKKIIVLSAVAIALGAMLFAGCAKPPTEKVAALQEQITKFDGAGAAVFASQQYDAVVAGMSELQTLMDNKKNKAATAKADSLTALVAEVETAIQTNAPAAAKQGVDAAKAELAKFKATMATPEAKKVIVKDELKKMKEMEAAFDKDAANLDAAIGNSAFLNAYNDANTLKGKIAAAGQEVAQKIEDAKAKKAVKPAAKKSPKKK
ncbi:MAG: hypothetical protein WCU00_02700 [Candidatus Latescibacterota bacterium]|jgi:hypothetical protein